MTRLPLIFKEITETLPSIEKLWLSYVETFIAVGKYNKIQVKIPEYNLTLINNLIINKPTLNKHLEKQLVSLYGSDSRVT